MKNKGFNFYFGLIIVLLLALAFLEYGKGRIQSSDTAYTRGRLVQDLSENRVYDAVIIPNEETPTGVVQITLTDGSEKILYATDVHEIENILVENHVDPVVRDVPGENILIKPFFCCIIIGVYRLSRI